MSQKSKNYLLQSAGRAIAAILMTIVSSAHIFGNARPQTAEAISPEGDWQGKLMAGGAELRLVLHIKKGTDGSLAGTLDSVDQGANGMPVSAIELKDSKLTFAVTSVGGSYEGKFSENGKTIKGSWTQGQSLPLDFQSVAVVPPKEQKAAKPSDIDGAWLGAIDAGAIKLRIVFHILNTVDGLTATMDSPDQGVKGMPVTSAVRNGASITLEMKQIGGKFEGKIDSGLSTMDGNWTQGGASKPFSLRRVKNVSELERKRPQMPVKPYPYKEEEVVYANKQANIELAATLTIPRGKGPFPAAILITGSGPQDRDESLMGHKPFLVLSDYLTRRGIAVLRTDDRGVGKSGGDFTMATTADFATDTEAGLAFLKTRAEIAFGQIGLIGHSEGGVIAPMVASRNPDIAFIVMMAGTGVPGDEILASQSLLISEASGTPHDAAERSANDERQILQIIKQEQDVAVIKTKLRERFPAMPQAQLDEQLKQLTSPWFRYFIAYDPAAALAKVKSPVLAVDGEKDLQVPPKQNLPAIRRALESGGNRNFEIVELPGLNHLFQTAATGLPAEYAEIEETMSPVALQKIAGWITEHTDESGGSAQNSARLHP